MAFAGGFGSAGAQTATLTTTTSQLSATGGTVTFTATIAYSGTPSALGFQVELPAGWTYAGGTGEPSIKPDAGTTGTLEWAYTGGFGVGASSFDFTASYPAGLSGVQTVAASAVYRSPLINLAIASVTLAPVSAPPAAPPSYTQGPPDRIVPAGSGTTFSVVVEGAPAPTLRWQYSTDDGQTWSNLTEGGDFSGVTQSTLTVAAATTGLSGYRFRTLASNAVQADVPSTSALLTVNAVAPSATLTTNASTYAAAGGTVTLTATIAYGNEPTSLGFQIDLPSGWSYEGGVGEPAIKPEPGTTGALEWAYSSGFGTGSSNFSFTLRYPAGLSGDQAIAGAAIYRTPLASLALAPVVFARAASAFETWQAARFNATELANLAASGPQADPDGDGLPNLMEYALALEPKIADVAGLPVASIAAANWIFTYTRPVDRTDLIYVVEVSTDLATWSAAGVAHERIAATGGTETWRASHPLAGTPALFFRLKVATAP